MPVKRKTAIDMVKGQLLHSGGYSESEAEKLARYLVGKTGNITARVRRARNTIRHHRDEELIDG